MKIRHTSLASALVGALAAISMVAASTAAETLSMNPAFVPTAEQRIAIKAAYSADRAECVDGTTVQTRAICLAEAAAAKAEALSGELGLLHPDGDGVLPDESDRLANALARCDILPSELQADCEDNIIEKRVIEPSGDAADGSFLGSGLPTDDGG